MLPSERMSQAEAELAAWPAQQSFCGPAGAALTVRNLTAGYGSTVAVADVSMQLGRAETVAIVGASGSGKTTLLLCVAGLLRPSSGEVLLGGEDLWSLTRAKRDEVRRQNVGYVAQFSDLVPELSNVENVALPVRLAGRSARESRQAAQERLDQFGIGHLGARYPHEVSGGEMQRVAIARALAHRPRVVIADEPTGALDEENGQLVLASLVQTARSLGTAVLVVTHDAVIAAGVGTVLRMREGRLASQVS